MPEKDFWRTMNPARLHALYNAWFGRRGKPGEEEPKQQKKQSLSAYIQGGG